VFYAPQFFTFIQVDFIQTASSFIRFGVKSVLLMIFAQQQNMIAGL